MCTLCTMDEKELCSLTLCPPDPGDARQLRPILGGDLQRQGDHGLECQLHGTKEPQNNARQVEILSS